MHKSSPLLHKGDDAEHFLLSTVDSVPSREYMSQSVANKLR